MACERLQRVRSSCGCSGGATFGEYFDMDLDELGDTYEADDVNEEDAHIGGLNNYNILAPSSSQPTKGGLLEQVCLRSRSSA